MSKLSIKVNGMYCESCEKLLKMEIGDVKGVSKVEADHARGMVEVEGSASEKSIADAIVKAGYGVGENYAGKSFEQEIGGFVSDFIAGKPSVKSVRTCFAYSIITFIVLAAAAFAGFASSKYFIYMIYAAISAVAVGGAIALFSAYRSRFNCMEGMMVGMTVGMSAGFLFGAIVGATNGMFVGSVFGMLVGMALGYYVGKACGVMGAMEGLMAGVMGGTMGAMLTVMMQFDHLGEFMLLFVLSNLLVLAGLKYMIYYYAGKRGEVKFMPPLNFFALALLLTALTVAVMLFAPHSASTILY